MPTVTLKTLVVRIGVGPLTCDAMCQFRIEPLSPSSLSPLVTPLHSTPSPSSHPPTSPSSLSLFHLPLLCPSFISLSLSLSFFPSLSLFRVPQCLWHFPLPCPLFSLSLFLSLLIGCNSLPTLFPRKRSMKAFFVLQKELVKGKAFAKVHVAFLSHSSFVKLSFMVMSKTQSYDWNGDLLPS